MYHLVRYSVMGFMGRFASVDAAIYPRGERVVCRTPRGLEVGEVLGPGNVDGEWHDGGTLLRRLSVSDELLLARLESKRNDAYQACSQWLDERKIPATLMDVEHLFDGQSLMFYFFGDVPTEVESLTDELAEVYDTQVQFRRFAETLSTGCGPGCGTEEATGAGCGTSCSTCSISGACGTKKVRSQK